MKFAWKLRRAPSAPDLSTLPRPDGPILAVGDIHGRVDLVRRARERLLAELTDAGAGTPTLVFLGDYVDRGTDSRGVLEELISFETEAPCPVICLMGNHEAMLLDFLDYPAERGARYLRHGGLETLASFGIGDIDQRSELEALTGAADALRAAMPTGIEDWLRNRPTWWRSGDVICVHAAMDPILPPEDQAPRPMLWGHPRFHRRPRADGLWVVHGHNVVEEPAVTHRRVACDTGAWFSNRLTVAAIRPGEAIRFLQV